MVDQVTGTSLVFTEHRVCPSLPAPPAAQPCQPLLELYSQKTNNRFTALFSLLAYQEMTGWFSRLLATRFLTSFSLSIGLKQKFAFCLPFHVAAGSSFLSTWQAAPTWGSETVTTQALRQLGQVCCVCSIPVVVSF